MSKEHLAVALALSVPIVVCITKVSECLYLISWYFTNVGSKGRHDPAEQTRRDGIAGGQNSA
jgi:hypothetical protein